MGIKISLLQDYKKVIGTLCDSKQYGGNDNKEVDAGKEKKQYNRAVKSWDGESFEFDGKRFDGNGSLFEDSQAIKQKDIQQEGLELSTTENNYVETIVKNKYSHNHESYSVSKGLSNKYDAQIELYANKYGIDSNRVKALIMNESGFNPNAISSTRDYGLMQLNSRYFKGDLTDIDTNLDQGCKYFAQCLETFGGDYDKALLAYNRGIGGAKSYLKSHSASDATYVQRVNGFYNQLNQNKNLRITA